MMAMLLGATIGMWLGLIICYSVYFVQCAREGKEFEKLKNKYHV